MDFIVQFPPDNWGTPVNYEIRKAREAEKDALARFLVEHAGDRFAQMARDYTACMFSNDYRRPTFLVAIDKAEIIGCAAYSHEMFTLLPVWGISWVNVRKDHRNRGFGQQLIEACIKDIEEKNPTGATVILATLPGKSALYDRVGFKKSGIDHADGWIMLKTLSAA